MHSCCETKWNPLLFINQERLEKSSVYKRSVACILIFNPPTTCFEAIYPWTLNIENRPVIYSDLYVVCHLAFMYIHYRKVQGCWPPTHNTQTYATMAKVVDIINIMEIITEIRNGYVDKISLSEHGPVHTSTQLWIVPLQSHLWFSKISTLDSLLSFAP